MQQVTHSTSAQSAKPAVLQRFVALAKAQLFQPIFASLAQSRPVGLALAGIVTAQIVLVALDLPAWPCPFKAALGIPCPGCGLSRAIVLLIRGDWRAAISTHAFAPVFLLGGSLLLVSSLLPGKLHRAAVGWIALWEQRTGITAFVLIGLVAYWGLRLMGVL